MSWVLFHDLIFFSFKTGDFYSEQLTGGELKTGSHCSELKGCNVGTPESRKGSISTTQARSRSLAPNEHLNHLHNVEKPQPQNGAGQMLLLSEKRGAGGEGNPHAPAEPLSLGQS